MTSLSCAKHNVAVEFYFADGYHFSQSERRAIQTVVDATLPNSVRWIVDPNHAGSVSGTIQRELRATLFHEFHHLVRYATAGRSESLMDEVVTECMATVFERDAAGASPPWGMYPKEAMNWVTELSALPPDADRTYWLTKSHVDGRRWIGMRAGAYLARTG
jgi:predicted Zn-dependent protease DUF2268